eukprot:CCRYP_016745-RA/>CCRYP_016745-RA protein AED:0.13 eAED:0.13 QI:0/0.77/0.9/1/0.77/0.9/10/1749/416
MMNSADEIDINAEQHQSNYTDFPDQEQASLLSPSTDQIHGFSTPHRLGGIDRSDDQLGGTSGGVVHTLRSRRRGAQQSANASTEAGTSDDNDDKRWVKQSQHAFHSPASKMNSVTMMHTSIDAGCDEGCIDDEYYFDDTNDQSWSCTFGTEEGDGVWLVRHDPPGTIMSLIAYSGITITLLAECGRLSRTLAMMYCTVCALALASHAKTMFTDPGAIPQCAVPVNSAGRRNEVHTMCSTCRSYKPPGSHHCRICDRCVSRMDHHCPWMNNCIGASNTKSFILFLVYTWIASAFALLIFGFNYFLCRDEQCEFGLLVHLVRFMTVICVFSLLFTSSMLSNITYGIMTGMGTIDRIKARASYPSPDEHPLTLQDIFGIGLRMTWLLPTDPLFADYDRVLGYSMPQRLLREGGDNNSIS